ncbi:MAG TPA: hypothetical protein VGD37_26335 [Kofleriaceae bacterium]
MIDTLVPGRIGGGICRGVLAVLAAIGCQVAPAGADTAPAALAPDRDPAAALANARAALGFARAGQSVIHYRAQTASEQNYQSDRSYPPFFSAMTVKEAWFDPTSGVERASLQATYPGSVAPPQVTACDGGRGFALSKGDPKPLPFASVRARYLNPWAVIADWSAATDVRTGGRELYRDYKRLVLLRATPEGEQRLLLDAKTGFPVKLAFIENHYLWGQRQIEYVYSNWTAAGGILVAASSFRIADGKPETSQTIGQVELIARAAAPALTLPADPARSPDSLPGFLLPLDLTTTQVGPHTYLLSNPGYTEAVTRIGDEVIVFDATQGEARARKDADAIARLFPGAREVTVVITDLAWPHIAGVRYWVASGATIVTHTAAREFLRSVIDRRWTAAPDLLEQRRRTGKPVHPRLVGIDATYRLAGGAVSLHPIDGIGTETALLGYIVADRFLWASDYIQTVSEPTAYAAEVVQAVRRDGLTPERAAAEHLPLTPWSQLEPLARL